MKNKSESNYLPNLLGAFVATIEDDLKLALESEVGAGGAGPPALLAVDTWPGCSIDFLRKVLALTHSGTVRLIARMGESGLVVRGAGPDGRTAALRLTGEGRKLARRVRKARRDILTDIVGEMNRQEQRVLTAVLDRVLRGKPRTRIEAQRACRLCDHPVCRDDACPIGSSVPLHGAV